MSLETWQKKFYPKTPTARLSKLAAIQHSLTKWVGLRRNNLIRHGLWVIRTGWNVYIGACVEGVDDDRLEIGSDSCALCVKYLDPNTSGVEVDCKKCPLYHARAGIPCTAAGVSQKRSPYASWVWEGDPEPMIKALKKTLHKEQKRLFK